MIDLAANCQDEDEFLDLLTENLTVDHDTFRRAYAKHSSKWLTQFREVRPNLIWKICELLKCPVIISEKTTNLHFCLIGAASRALMDDPSSEAAERSPSAQAIMRRFWEELPTEIRDILFPHSDEAEL